MINFILRVAGIALLSSVSILLSAQDYSPTAVEGANWIIIDSETHHWPNFAFVRSIQGDTILDGVTYKKLYQQVIDRPDTLFWQDLPQPYTVFPERELIALLRDDVAERRVYGRVIDLNVENSALSPDTLFHDYAVESGGYVEGYFFLDDSVKVDTVREIFLFGQIRRVQGINGASFIEGIGSTLGPTSGDSFIYLNCCLWRLVDYCVGDFSDCSIISPVVNFPENHRITIFPNPVSNELNIASTNPFNVDVNIKLTDLAGRVLRTEVFRQHINLSVPELAAGMYLLTFTMGERQVVRKFVKR